MKITEKIVQPEYGRKPDFVGEEVNDAIYSFGCIGCGRTVSIAVRPLTQLVWGWENSLGPEATAEVKSHFQLNMVGRSHDGGLPAVTRCNCDACDAAYLLYIGVTETANSYYTVTVQGLSKYEA